MLAKDKENAEPHPNVTSQQFSFENNSTSLLGRENLRGFKRIGKNSMSKVPNLSMSVRNTNNCYVNFSSPACTVEINRSVFPYCLDDESNSHRNPIKKGKINITNLIRAVDEKPQQFLPMGSHFIEREDPPVNEYLSYDLSKQINSGIYEVRVLAEQIKHIKREKQKKLEEKENYKPHNKIRIKNTGTLASRFESSFRCK